MTKTASGWFAVAGLVAGLMWILGRRKPVVTVVPKETAPLPGEGVEIITVPLPVEPEGGVTLEFF